MEHWRQRTNSSPSFCNLGSASWRSQSGQARNTIASDIGINSNDPVARIQLLLLYLSPPLTNVRGRRMISPPRWGRTGFDLGDTPEAACRGRCVGLVNHRIKKQLTKN